jgi:hypothetical protein
MKDETAEILQISAVCHKLPAKRGKKRKFSKIDSAK